MVGLWVGIGEEVFVVPPGPPREFDILDKRWEFALEKDAIVFYVKED